jgi:regulation of enolase protein 1 (concanavalin A-like superfamily)
MFDGCIWLNEPKRWRRDGDALKVQTDPLTDFWRETHYGFIHDSGHFLGHRTDGDFTAQVRVRGRYEALYDQAGIMVRIDEANWVKAGIELSDGEAQLSSVLTIGRSDWATGRYPHEASDFRIRTTVTAGVLRIQVSPDGRSWPLVRLAPFPIAPSYTVGPICCTPQREGLVVEFSEFEVTAPSQKDLHDLS